MNRKIIGILGLVGLVLTGCAAPEVETEQTMMGSYSSDEIMQDNGRKIEKHFQNEGEDGVLDINAVVDIPDISLKEGVIQSKEWDISMLENVLCPGTDMILEQNSQSDYTRYIGGAAYNDLDYAGWLSGQGKAGTTYTLCARLDNLFRSGYGYTQGAWNSN